MLRHFSESVKSPKSTKTVFLLPKNFEESQFSLIRPKAEPVINYEKLKKIIRFEKNLPIEKRNAWVGFIPYEAGAKWQGIQPAWHENHTHHPPPEVYFLPYRVVPGQTFDKDQIDFLNYLRRSIKTLNKFLSKTESIQPNLSKSAYLEKIKKIKAYLRSGDTYQVNFSQRFTTQFEGDPMALFLALARKNPSPHQFFCDTPEFSVISNSPERLACGYRKDGRFMVETRPIKGTVPRGLTPKEDAQNIEKLIRSEKEKAELVMIVDLERNDLGKICVPGTVAVTEHRTIEKYSHVIHTVSNIEGELSHERDVFDVLESLFPGGSITGCPKKRTMEIIAELEDSPRGVYCGSAGVIYPDGSFDFNIMIRTAFIDKKSGLLTYSAGGGIVIDSDPGREYEETLHKAQAFLEVI